jgi:hypothetical protein
VLQVGAPQEEEVEDILQVGGSILSLIFKVARAGE